MARLSGERATRDRFSWACKKIEVASGDGATAVSRAASQPDICPARFEFIVAWQWAIAL